MDAATLVLKKTVPADQAKNKKAIEVLSKAALKQSPLQFLPFDVLEDVGNDQEEDEEKPFLLCSYNQVQGGTTYRSPYTSRLFTVKAGKADQIAPPKNIPEDEKDIRNLEMAANEVWWPYVQMYYGWEGIGSVFLKRGKGSSFEGVFGVHKKSEDNSGTWDSVHLVQVDEPKNGSCNYRLDSAVVMSIRPYKGSTVSSSLNKETVKSLKVRATGVAGNHLENLGKIMEDVEMEFRSRLERVHIPRSLEIMESVYKTGQDAVTAADITGVDESEAPMNLTGMGVGPSMIGEIASKAEQKQAEGSSFLESMKAQQKAREAEMKEQNNEYYSEIKSSLKKSSLSPTPTAKAPIVPGSPGFMGKASLKKTNIPPKLPLAPASPTPEFANFRNKLKKSGK